MAKKTKKKKSSKAKVGLGLAAVAAGAYILYGKEAAKYRTKAKKTVKGWSLKAKGEVLERLEKCKDLSEEEYSAILDKVERKYTALKSVNNNELKQMMKELKGHWKSIKRQLAQENKSSQKTSSSSARETTKRKTNRK